MILVTDTRETCPLIFPKVVGVEYVRETMPTGDYTARHGDALETTICERKALGDCYSSFTGDNYERERAKILRAKEAGQTYILAIEGTFSEVLKGHSYYKDGEWHVARKTGLAMCRQLMTLQRKYGIQVWFCANRAEMAMMIQEYFLAQERVTVDA